MKTNIPNLRLALIALTLLVFSGANSAYAQSTAFTYNGRLNNNGAPVSGPHDMRFTLHSLPAGVNVVGGPLLVSMVDVVNGLFTVRIEFLENVFTGPARWLEVEVRPAGAAAFTTLTPRQEVTSSPYAIRAQTAGSVPNGTVTANQLSSGGVLPTTGQFLSYDGGKFLWRNPGVAVGDVWSRNGAGDAYYNGAKVGIGTSEPLAPLEVIGPVRSTRISGLPQYIQLNGGDSGSIKLTAQSNLDAEKNLFIENLSGQATPGANNNMQFVLGTTAARSTKMTINRDGAVGIGTLTPEAKLHLYDPASVTQRIETGGGVNAWAQLRFKNANGEWYAGTSRSFNNDEFYISRVGSPINAFSIPASGFEIRFATADLYLGHLSRRGLPGRALVDYAVPGGPQQLVLNFANDWAETYIGGNKTTFAGDVSVRSITIRGADVAEPFDIAELDLPKGTVVVIDATRRGGLKRSTAAYDTCVAGIVSGANGVDTGIILSQPGVNEGGQNVALSGRVYVQADATFGAIKPGDLLTTSDTPGHAMKVTDHAKAQGAILGKAMSGLKAGKGMVLVLVTLQ
jgi:hypothetical protein